MTEEEARNWLGAHFDVSRETWGKLETFVAFLKAEAEGQNLISASTLDQIWARHIVDSAQLLAFAPVPAGKWIDLGSGAGFPGLVVALLSDWHVTLVESRAKRIDYLNRTIALLGLESRAAVAGMPVERVETANFGVISARAFAPLPKLLDLSARFSTDKTKWLLPKGRNAVNELEEARKAWELDFSVQPSVTDPEAGILVGTVRGTRAGQKPGVPAKGRRKR
ncbi:MAG: 16S rRNA (guanine(527)-N(7))-methyltransferase RsmG [Sphingomonadales bacterium]|jgi:16S rRNA (guanine527-N7)-methyltransferase|nr:16S rRNA (guanine(527)-N(7))-methyltransferase RsmG [Sphingomonadales bacterium]MBK9004977.1 16S rRNA (guanine(527)-N(7))-methyltransferase RsmG [Sphingomonadales bacterium]MBK9267290.1 16S rRNA (guanine(527)-N(7))-methyltransferase RsmG [Sphingomonadales bacterium]MBP6434325.1 16S rRNA (guanine(527)-N(7))-methyltransferase RsmG [Sphingorhabdus sp.]